MDRSAKERVDPPPSGWLTDHWRDGRRAAAARRNVDECPHPLWSDAARAWMDGFRGVLLDRAKPITTTHRVVYWLGGRSVGRWRAGMTTKDRDAAMACAAEHHRCGRPAVVILASGAFPVGAPDWYDHDRRRVRPEAGVVIEG